MPHDAAPDATGPTKLVIRNIGMILSGKLEEPIYEADCLVAEAGKITGWGRAADMDCEGATTTVDAMGVTLAPGLIDSHVHPVVGDYTPRQQQLHWIDSTLHGGVTTLISAGEVHMPGRPRDIVGLKAMAIAAQRWYENFRPSGMKVHAGAPVIEHGMVEEDFAELARAGVTLLGEVGLGNGQGWQDGGADGWLGAQIRHPEHDPHRRAVDPRIGPDRRRHGDRDRDGRDRPHQRRPFGAARRPDPLPVRALHLGLRDRAQRQRARGRPGAQCRAGTGQARPDHPRDRRPGGLGRAAAGHPADDRDAVVVRQSVQRGPTR